MKYLGLMRTKKKDKGRKNLEAMKAMISKI